MNKKELGAFYTTNAKIILDGFEDIVKGKTVVDPFCGERDLLNWANFNGAKKTIGCDINPKVNPDITINSILSPLNYNKYDLVVTNPPYLGSNKTKSKAPFIMWETTDLYKASLLSIAETANEIISIIPSNLFFDNDDKFRNRLFNIMKIKKVICFDKAMFQDTNVRVCVIHAVKGKTTHLHNHELYNTKVGKQWYQLLEKGSNNISRLTNHSEPKGYVSNICVKTTDTGSDDGEIHACITKPFYAKISDRNSFTAVFPTELTKQEEDYIVSKFNELLKFYRTKYESMFLTNFLAGKDGVIRKRISFKDSLSLLSAIYKEKYSD
jgi:hypothetical protein